MLLSRIPVRIVSADPNEHAAIADVLAGGQAGSLSLADGGEQAVVALVCPTGRVEDVSGMPAVVLGARREDGADASRSVQIPARLADVFDALEALAQEAINLSEPRRHGGWVLDFSRLALSDPDGRGISLTDTEARLLAMLFDAQGQELDRDTLLQKVWGYRPGLDTHTLETHIYRLRQKIETNPTSPAFLMTTDAGYRLN